MEFTITLTELFWAIVVQTVIIVGCFIAIDRYAFKRAMLFAHNIQDIKDALDIVLHGKGEDHDSY